MEDKENFRALAAMFALSKLAGSVFDREAQEIAKDCVLLADALLEELDPQEGLVALKKRRKNVSE
jgi:hypothetical protein